MDYVDGYVLAVPNDKKDAYIAMAEVGATVFKECGALHVTECWADDVPDGKLTSFPMAVKLQEGESVVFSWSVWPSREARDTGMKKVMEDERLKTAFQDMPFDGKRMIFGGFRMVVDR